MDNKTLSTPVRHYELDLLKTFTIIICMIPVHVWLSHSDGFETTFTFIVDSVLGGLLAAPVFMFCMGMGFGFTRHNSPGEFAWRGVKLLTFGAALSILVTLVPYLLYGLTPWQSFYNEALPSLENMDKSLMQSLPTILTADIMQLAGLSFLFFALLRKLKLNSWIIFLIACAMNLVATYVETTEILKDQPFLSYLPGYFIMTSGVSCFPLFTWFLFIAGGNLFGDYYRKYSSDDKFYSLLVILGGLLTFIYLINITPDFTIFDEESDFYGMIALDAIRVVAFIPFLIGVWWLIEKIVPSKWMTALTYPSKHINQFYCISWVIICITMGFMQNTGIVHSDWGVVADSLVVIALTTLAVYLYNKYLIKKTESFFASHKYIWIAAVWIIWAGSIFICNI